MQFEASTTKPLNFTWHKINLEKKKTKQQPSNSKGQREKRIREKKTLNTFLKVIQSFDLRTLK